MYSFIVPWLSDGSLALIQTAVPLLAIRYGASSLALGGLGFIAQTLRLPICFTAGQLSERVGRRTVILPAAAVVALGAVGLSLSRGYWQIMVVYALVMAAIGAFYPPLQALVCEVSRRGQLTRNLGMFNLGWCTGGAVAALAAGLLVAVGLRPTLLVAAVGMAAAGSIVALWPRATAHKDADEAPRSTAGQHGHLLLIARIGHVAGFFGFTAVRMVFPRLGIDLGWSEAEVAATVALLLWGQAIGMVAAAASPWWRGKLWPQAAAQSLLLVSGLTVAASSSAVVIATALFGIGFAQSIAYTAALYHGLASGSSPGRNAGIHESLVATGNITGSLVGGVTAQYLSPRAPYLTIAVLGAACLLVTSCLWIAGRRGTRA